MTALARFLLGVCWGLAAVSGQAEEPQPGSQVAQSVEVTIAGNKRAPVRYLLFLPKDYAKQESWPLMLFLHGAGERGDDIELVKKWGPPASVAKKPDFPFVLVSPQCPTGRYWDVEELAQLVAHVADAHHVDKNRMVVTGLSMGGYGSWGLVARYPNLFAAAVPICGGGDPASAEKIKDIPIWAFHGDKDDVVPLEQTTLMIDAIMKAGGTPRITVYPGVGYNSWSATYDNPEVYQWLLAQRRKAKP